jgi:hypothetical protein
MPENNKNFLENWPLSAVHAGGGFLFVDLGGTKQHEKFPVSSYR